MVRSKATTRGRPKRPPEAASTPITKFLLPVASDPKQGNSPSPHKIQMLATAVRGQQVLKEATQTSVASFFAVRRSSRKPGKTLAEEKERQMQETVDTLSEEHLVIKHFEEKGRGVVSTRDISKGEMVVEYAGELIGPQEARRREQQYSADQNTGCYMYYFMHRAVQHCVDATAESGRMGRLVNHSRMGNLQPRTIEVKCRPRLVLVAKEDIEAGRELLYDYGDRSRDSLKNHPWLAS